MDIAADGREGQDQIVTALCFILTGSISCSVLVIIYKCQSWNEETTAQVDK